MPASSKRNIGRARIKPTNQPRCVFDLLPAPYARGRTTPTPATRLCNIKVDGALAESIDERVDVVACHTKGGSYMGHFSCDCRRKARLVGHGRNGVTRGSGSCFPSQCHTHIRISFDYQNVVKDIHNGGR